MEKRYKLLGVAVISFAVVLISSFLMLVLDNDTGEDSDFGFASLYISDTYEEDVVEEGDEGDDLVAPEKEIELDENRKVLQFDSDLSEKEIEAIEEEYDIEFTEDESVSGIYTVITTEESDVDTLVEEEGLDTIETDIPVKMSADRIDWGIQRIGADKVWESSSGSGVVVAIVDTGIQGNHPDIGGNIVSGYNFVSNTSDASDDNGHGTHVAGIVAAVSNDTGVIGASYSAKLMPVKVLDSYGSGYLSNVAKGIYWAADNGARIINMSLGATTDSDILRNAVRYAAQKGVLIVAAAGNDYGSPCQYPAAYSEVICVVATDSNNQLASFSNVGGELAAPGVSNYSTYIPSTYRSLSGTSMASPHVAGSLAVARVLCTECSATELRTALRETATDLGTTGQDIIFGYGLVDLVSLKEKFQPTEEEEELPVTDPVLEDPVEETPTVEIVKQSIEIVEPVLERGVRYTPESSEDVLFKFSLDPVSSATDLKDINLYIDNELVYTTKEQSGEYSIDIEELEGVQHFVTVSATFNSGKKDQEKIILDLSKLQISSSTLKQRGRSVLGITSGISIQSIFDFFGM